MSCFHLAEQRKHLTVLFSLANLFQLPNPLLESFVLHNGTGELVSLRKLFKLSLTQRLPSCSLSEPLSCAKNRGNVLHRVHIKLLASLGKNRYFCTFCVARKRILRTNDGT